MTNPSDAVNLVLSNAEFRARAMKTASQAQAQALEHQHMWFKEIFGDEWDVRLDPEDNLRRIAFMVTQFRKLAQMNQFFVKRMQKWVEETDAIPRD